MNKQLTLSRLTGPGHSGTRVLSVALTDRGPLIEVGQDVWVQVRIYDPHAIQSPDEGEDLMIFQIIYSSSSYISIIYVRIPTSLRTPKAKQRRLGFLYHCLLHRLSFSYRSVAGSDAVRMDVSSCSAAGGSDVTLYYL